MPTTPPDPFPVGELADPTKTREDDRFRAVSRIVQTDPTLMAILQTSRRLDLPDAWLVSGAIYQTIWNALTGRPEGYGIKDYDLIYFDGSDLSYDAEDKVIRRVADAIPELAERIEVRNQARVHLWYENRFGRPYEPLSCSLESLVFYASKTHAVAVRLTQGNALEVHAPFGLANIFAMRLVPNTATNNRATHEEKGARMKTFWPELTVVPWPSRISS
ncbi:hypothetical protein GCM10011316_32460 [Roseibium aquae]|uniref:Nucleotidyltransferase family protein n=1 Tax=Roseibium aquae TaxID=1323746 RepID=A0A916TMD2_9HYPH|nr:nucleotidyltransferase family protein [Roseibium aquae]GGB57891.1 hypothetical protein GCM10011316_32460 [Roseibium aquae]